ncbi:MAG: hypothetical protein ACM3O6_09185 [Acidobacteriota bacterium]
MRLIVRIGSTGVLAALAGCGVLGGSKTCSEPQHYQNAVSAAPLHAAEGLPPANTKNALKIPEGGTEAKPRKATDPCLDESPSFYPDRPKPKPPK